MLLEFLWFVVGHIIRIIFDILTVILSPFVFIYYGYKRNNFFQTKTFKSVLITGGSSGIGKAVALELIRQNPKTNIIITGTNKRRLAKAVQEFQDAQTSSTSSSSSSSITTGSSKSKSNSFGAIVSQELDVRNKDEMKEFIHKMDAKYELDLVIANAGTSARMTEAPHYFVSSRTILDVNCQGVLNTILPIIPKFQDRKKGHIACTGSIGGYVPNTWSSSYAGSKAYVRFLCDDLRPKLKMIGNIDVTYIAPGYVRSRMCQEELNKNNIGFMKEYDAANIIVAGLKSNDSIIMFPNQVASLGWWLGSLHPILNGLVWDRFTSRESAAQEVGFFHEFDPNDEFGGEC